MALKKIKVMFGTECWYWKIISIGEDRISGTTTCTLGLYRDEVSRRENVNNYIDSQAYSFGGIKFSDAELYNLIKTQTDFLNSEDV